MTEGGRCWLILILILSMRRARHVCGRFQRHVDSVSPCSCSVVITQNPRILNDPRYNQSSTKIQRIDMYLLGLIKRLRFLFLFIVLVTVLLLKSSQIEMVHEQAANYVFVLLLVYILWVISHEKRIIWVSITCLCFIELSLIPGLSFYQSDSLIFFRDMITTIFYALMFIFCVRLTLRDNQVTVTTLFGSLSAYLFLGLFWSYLFQCIVYANPEAFLGLSSARHHCDNDFIYYSFVTMTTLGYGDVIPQSPMAKTLSWMAAFAGQAYLTILMALLVAKFAQKQAEMIEGKDEDG